VLVCAVEPFRLARDHWQEVFDGVSDALRRQVPHTVDLYIDTLQQPLSVLKAARGVAAASSLSAALAQHQVAAPLRELLSNSTALLSTLPATLLTTTPVLLPMFHRDAASAVSSWGAEFCCTAARFRLTFPSAVCLADAERHFRASPEAAAPALLTLSTEPTLRTAATRASACAHRAGFNCSGAASAPLCFCRCDHCQKPASASESSANDDVLQSADDDQYDNNADEVQKTDSQQQDDSPNSRRPWTEHEDALLRAAAAKHKEREWHLVAKEVPNRDRHRCRSRYLLLQANADPRRRTGPWKQAEIEQLRAGVATHGRNWATVAKSG